MSEKKLKELFGTPFSEKLNEAGDPIGYDKVNPEIVKEFENLSFEDLLARTPEVGGREWNLINATLRNKVLKGEEPTAEQLAEMRAREINI